MQFLGFFCVCVCVFLLFFSTQSKVGWAWLLQGSEVKSVGQQFPHLAIILLVWGKAFIWGGWGKTHMQQTQRKGGFGKQKQKPKSYHLILFLWLLHFSNWKIDFYLHNIFWLQFSLPNSFQMSPPLPSESPPFSLPFIRTQTSKKIK